MINREIVMINLRGFIKPVAAVGIAFSIVSSVSAVEAHNPECSWAWDASSARYSCYPTQWIQKSGTGCWIVARCGGGNTTNDYGQVNGPGGTEFTGSYEQVRALNNCGGKLKVGSC
jgi:hypothetical protein